MSLFSGIEACSVAWHPLGWECVGVSEIEPFPCAVLAYHYPNTPNLGDVTQITEEQIKALGSIDVVVGGSPCQDLSVAGKRKGMINADGTITRSGLFYNQYNIFKWAQKRCGARFLLWENVPGAFSSNKGADFASVVSLMAGLDDLAPPENGWGGEGIALGDNGLLEWCTLDAQHFGVAQRRRRVFALLDAGDWRNRPPILLERESLRGNTAPSRSEGQEITRCPRSSLASGKPTTGTLMANAGTKLWLGNQEVFSGDYRILHQVTDTLTSNGDAHSGFRDEKGLVLNTAYGIPGNWIGRKPENGGNAIEPMHNVAPCLTKTDIHGVAHPVVLMDQGGSAMNVLEDGTVGTLRRETHGHEPCIVAAFKGGQGSSAGGIGYDEHTSPTLTSAESGSNRTPALLQNMAVRRLTPIECERLQGFPDGYTDINPKGKQTPDGSRYKALGNSMAVPVMQWIGKQIRKASEA